MNIYLLKADANKYQNLILADEDNWNYFNSFDGKPLNYIRTDITVKVFDEQGKSQNLPPSDFPTFASHVPVFSYKARTELFDLLQNNGQYVPLTCGHEVYYAYNVTDVADVLDKDNSEIKRFKNSGGIMDVAKYEFIPKLMSNNIVIFKIPETVLMDVFVTDTFVKRVKSSRLLGMDFRKIYK